MVKRSLLERCRGVDAALRARAIALAASMICVATGWSTTACAHGIWIAQRAGAAAVVMGKGPEDLRIEPGRLARLDGVDAQGRTVTIARRDLADGVRFDWSPVLAAVHGRYLPPDWVRAPDGTWRRGALAPGEPGTAFSYERYGLHCFRACVAAASGHGRLAIVPLAEPLSRSPGDPLPVRVLFDGAPLARHAVVVDYVNAPGAPPVLTDAAGEARVPVRNEGLNVMMVLHAIDLTGDDGRPRRHVMSGSLSFVLPFVHDGRAQDPFERGGR